MAALYTHFMIGSLNTDNVGFFHKEREFTLSHINDVCCKNNFYVNDVYSVIFYFF